MTNNWFISASFLKIIELKNKNTIYFSIINSLTKIKISFDRSDINLFVK